MAKLRVLFTLVTLLILVASYEKLSGGDHIEQEDHSVIKYMLRLPGTSALSVGSAGGRSSGGGSSGGRSSGGGSPGGRSSGGSFGGSKSAPSGGSFGGRSSSSGGSKASATPSHSSLPSRPAANSMSRTPSHSSLPSRPAASSISRTPSHSSLPSRPAASSISRTPSHSSLPSRPAASSISRTPSHSSLPSRSAANSMSRTPSHSSLPSRPAANSNPTHSTPIARPSTANKPAKPSTATHTSTQKTNVQRPRQTPKIPKGPSSEKRYTDASNLQSMVARNEGKKYQAYIDTKGHPTVGIGFNLDRSDARSIITGMGLNQNDVRSGKTKLTDAQVSTLFQKDVSKATDAARKLVPTYNSQPKAVQNVIADMGFNMGTAGLQKWKQFAQQINNKDYKAAAESLKSSKLCSQIGNRCARNVNVLMDLSKQK